MEVFHRVGLNSSSDAGPDCVYACLDALSLPLYFLFARSLSEGELPDKRPAQPQEINQHYPIP